MVQIQMFKYQLLILFGVLKSAEMPAQSFRGLYDNDQHSTFILGMTASRSIRGWKAGGDIGALWSNRLFLGAFWYRSLRQSTQIATSFFGLGAAYYFIRKDLLSLGPSMRLGLFEGRFLSLIPTLELMVKVDKRMSIAGGVGRSDRHPYFNLRTMIQWTN